MYAYMIVLMFMCMYKRRINLISIQIAWKLNIDTFTCKLRQSKIKIDDIFWSEIWGLSYVFKHFYNYVCTYVHTSCQSDTHQDSLEIKRKHIFIENTSFYVKNWRFGRGFNMTPLRLISWISTKVFYQFLSENCQANPPLSPKKSRDI